MGYLGTGSEVRFETPVFRLKGMPLEDVIARNGTIRRVYVDPLG